MSLYNYEQQAIIEQFQRGTQAPPSQQGPPAPPVPQGQPPGQPQSSPAAPTTVGETGKMPEGEVLSVEKTTGDDRYIVRTQIPGADLGVYKQTIMSSAEVKAAGGEIPISGIWGQGVGTKWASPDTPTLESQARQKGEFEKGLSEYPLYVQQAYEKGGIEAASKGIEEYNQVMERRAESFEAAAKKAAAERYQTAAERAAFEHEHTRIGDAWLKKEDAESLRKQEPYLWQLLNDKGYEAYKEAIAKREADISQIYERNYVTIGDEMIKKSDWQTIKPQYQEIARTQGFDAMDKAMEADFQATMSELEPYKTKGGDRYDTVKYLKENPGKEQVLRDAGFNEADIQESSKASKLNLAQVVWRGMTPWKEEKGEAITAKGGTIMAAELIVPGVYAGRHWREMSAPEKAIAVAIDVACLVPFATAAGEGARVVGVAGKAARLAAAGKALGREAAAQAMAPVNIIIHPVGAAKTTVRELRNLVETIAHPKKLSEVVTTTSSGVIKLETSRFTTPEQAMAARDILTEKARAGERIFIQIEDKTIELTRSPLMREVGGGMAHASPDIELLWEKGGKVVAREGLPAKEQGLFFATEPATEFTQGSAFGRGVIPVPEKATDAVWDVSKYRISELVRVDKAPIRPLNFTDANIPKGIGKPLQDYVRNEGGLLYGSMNEWTRIKKTGRPNDIDLAFRDQNKAINDIIDICEKAGYKTRRVAHAVEVNERGNWWQIADVADLTEHRAMLPEGLSGKTVTKIDGITTETMGEQYLRQSIGATSKTLKAATRAERVNKAAGEVKKMLKKAGALKRKPGILISKADMEPTDKLFHGTAEMERKILVSADVPQPKQILFTRIGPTSERIEIGLEKPLSARQIVKLKAEGLIEWAKAPFKEPIKIKETAKVTGLNNKQVKGLSGVLKRSGNIDQADSLLRAERLAASGRKVVPPLSRILGRVKTSAVRAEMDRLSVSATGRARPERLPMSKRIERLPARRLSQRFEVLVGQQRPVSQRGPGRERGTTRAAAPGRAERIVREGRLPRERRLPREGRLPRERIPRPPREERPPRIPRLPRERPPRTRPTRTLPPRIPRIRRIPIPDLKSEKEKRHAILEADGAIAWRQGKIGSKDRWDVIINPYQDNSDYVMVLGKAPEGAVKFATGPRSAYKTAQEFIKGNPPKREVYVDSGFQDVIVTPESGHRVSLEFKPDPQGRTRGNITIGERTPSITERISISRGRERISPRAPRISPKMPRLR